MAHVGEPAATHQSPLPRSRRAYRRALGRWSRVNAAERASASSDRGNGTIWYGRIMLEPSRRERLEQNSDPGVLPGTAKQHLQPQPQLRKQRKKDLGIQFLTIATLYRPRSSMHTSQMRMHISANPLLRQELHRNPPGHPKLRNLLRLIHQAHIQQQLRSPSHSTLQRAEDPRMRVTRVFAHCVSKN